MKNFLSYDLGYRNNTAEYNRWNTSCKKPFRIQNDKESREIAKTITEPVLLFDRYEHKKAEDSETFFQTLNIELMSAATLITSLPLLAKKAVSVLNKHNSLKKPADTLSKFANAKVNIAGKPIEAAKLASVFSFIGGAAFYTAGMKKSMENQLGLIRKASFDASNEILSDPKFFAKLTPEQQKKVDSTTSFDDDKGYNIADKLKDRLNINSSFKSVNEYRQNKKEYEKEKSEYFRKIKTDSNSVFPPEQSKKSELQRQVLDRYLKNVENDVLEPLRRVETISNITYSSLFTGGFLEYLISDKLVDVLHIKNKPVRGIVKLGVPIFTYLLLNKNISNIENKAILATKYKHLKHFSENPQDDSEKAPEKQSLPQFIKTVAKDMKDYDEFANKELPQIERRMNARKLLNISNEQEEDAKLLQKNTQIVLNTHRENVYNETIGIKSLSETILGPIDIIATALGAKIGNMMSKKCTNKKLTGLFTGIGAVAAFIPAAVIEAKLTKQQKLAEKIAAMKSVKDIENIYKPSNSLFDGMKTPEIFNEFLSNIPKRN